MPHSPVHPSPSWHHAADAAWQDIPHDRRVRWCAVQLDFPPIWFGTFPMNHTAEAVRRNSYTNIAEWAAVAHDFESAGFTPDEYYLLRLCVSHSLRDGEHPLARRTTGNPGGPVCITLTAHDWIRWPALAKTTTPMRATRLILDGR